MYLMKRSTSQLNAFAMASITATSWRIVIERMLLNEVIFQGVRILQEGTPLLTYHNKK